MHERAPYEEKKRAGETPLCSFSEGTNACENQPQFLYLIICILFALSKKQDRTGNHKEREDIKSRKHFAVFNKPWRSANVLLAFPLCLLLLFPLSTLKSLNPNSKTSFRGRLCYKQYFAQSVPQLIATQALPMFPGITCVLSKLSPIHCPRNQCQDQSQCTNDVLLHQLDSQQVFIV